MRVESHGINTNVTAYETTFCPEAILGWMRYFIDHGSIIATPCLMIASGAYALKCDPEDCLDQVKTPADIRLMGIAGGCLSIYTALRSICGNLCPGRIEPGTYNPNKNLRSRFLKLISDLAATSAAFAGSVIVAENVVKINCSYGLSTEVISDEDVTKSAGLFFASAVLSGYSLIRYFYSNFRTPTVREDNFTYQGYGAIEEARINDGVVTSITRGEGSSSILVTAGAAIASPLPQGMIGPLTTLVTSPPAAPPPGMGLPTIALGHEEIYMRFMGGKLVYRPTSGSDVERREIRFSDVVNPSTLEGTFNLSGCGDTGSYLSINSGYRKGKIATNENKVEVWIVPKFVIEKNLTSSAHHLAPIMDSFISPVGIFWTRGGWNNMNWYDYLITQNFDTLSDGKNLSEKWRASDPTTKAQHQRPPGIFGYSGYELLSTSPFIIDRQMNGFIFNFN
jgi:hypothetical protein